VIAYLCPECGEPARRTSLGDQHLDGTPLCPIMGAGGYEPARAVATDSPEGQQTRADLLDAFGADAALDVLRDGKPEQDVLGGALDRTGVYGLDHGEVAPAIDEAFRRHLDTYRARP